MGRKYWWGRSWRKITQSRADNSCFLPFLFLSLKSPENLSPPHLNTYSLVLLFAGIKGVSLTWEGIKSMNIPGLKLKALFHHLLASVVNSWLALASDFQASFFYQNTNKIPHNTNPHQNKYMFLFLSRSLGYFAQGSWPSRPCLG